MYETKSFYEAKQKLILLGVVSATVLPAFLALVFFGQHYADIDKNGIAFGFGALALFFFVVLVICFSALIEAVADYFRFILKPD